MQQKSKPKAPAAQAPAGRGVTKEDQIRKMIEQDPQKAAELIRQLFLNDK